MLIVTGEIHTVYYTVLARLTRDTVLALPGNFPNKSLFFFSFHFLFISNIQLKSYFEISSCLMFTDIYCPFYGRCFLGGYDRPGSTNEFNKPGLPCFEIRSTIPTARCCMNTVLESHRKWTVKFGIPRSALRFFHLAISVH